MGQNADAVLSGIRVVELASMVMVPSAGAVLADFGAEVIKVEPPEGDLNRRGHHIPGMPSSDTEYCFFQDNRSKQSVVLDLKDPRARSVFLRLIESADVLLTNYRARALDRLGLNWDQLQRVNPRLIFAHGTGYGDDGPDANKPGYDAVCYWSRSALEATMFPIEGWLGSVGYGTGDHPSGMTLFASIILALFDRERTGHGRRVTTSLVACGAWANATTIQAKLIGATFHARRRREETLNFGAVYYKSREGRIFKFAIVDWPKTWPAFCRAAGRPDLIDDERYRTAEARAGRMGELVAAFDAAFAQHDLDHWLSSFAAHDVPCSVLATYDDVVADPQLEAAGAFIDIDHPQLGRVRSVASPIHLEGATKPVPAPAPRVGQHTRLVLRGAGLAEEEIEALLRARAAIGE